MSVKSEPYFWVECDGKGYGGDGCDAKAPDGDEYSAFGEAEQAITYAEDSDWVITAAGEHYCPNCVTQDAKNSAHLVSTVRGDPLPGLAEPRACPDCEQGKHRNCTGEAWDNQADDFTRCPCTDLAHIEVRDLANPS